MIPVWPNSATKYTAGNNVWTEKNHSVVGVIDDPKIVFSQKIEAYFLSHNALPQNETFKISNPM
jgi:hypothetical protein